MFTVSTGEEHEDFKTLKEEVQREIQEVKKLNQAGQNSLLTCLSKLLGKKKELQDLELTVRSQRKVAGGWVCVGVTTGRGQDRTEVVSGWENQVWVSSLRLARCPPHPHPAATALIMPLEKGTQDSFSQSTY